jgi:6-pyruvoyltetrahydropterin/6-carboxytetrahydropterin synthase
MISKQFDFAAAHHLNGLPADHKCARVHGHNYLVQVQVYGDLDAVGFVVDYGDLSFLGDYLRDRLDHRDLNQVLTVNPTAENLAAHLLDLVRSHIDTLYEVTVGVSETPKVWAWCTE